MSKKRGMSKQQRLYYEYQNKDRVRQELAESAKQERDRHTDFVKAPNPHENSYYT